MSELDYDYVVVYVGKNIETWKLETTWEIGFIRVLFCCRLDVN